MAFLGPVASLWMRLADDNNVMLSGRWQQPDWQPERYASGVTAARWRCVMRFFTGRERADALERRHRLREPIQMPAIYPDDLTSELSVYDLPLDAEDGFDNIEYEHTMHRISLSEGEPGTPVSAFNSSI